MQKLDLNQCVETVGGWLHTEPCLLSWVVAGAIGLLLFSGLFCLARLVFKLFGGQVCGPNLAYTLLVFGSTALGAGSSAYNQHEPWVGGLIGMGIGAIVSGVACVIGAIAKYCN